MKKVKIARHLQDPKDRVRPQVNTGPGKTEQAHKDQTDMNYILRDYRKTGLIKHAAKHEGRYDDIPALDFQTAMFKVTQAQQMFESLPADMRKRFGNDPAAFLGFVQNPDNKGELERMGILRGNDGLDINGAQIGSPVQTPQDPPVEESPPGP